MMTTHTTWKIVKEFDDEDCSLGLYVKAGEEVIASLPGIGQHDFDHAKRIVTCVSALDGLNQDALDGGWNFKDHGRAARQMELQRNDLLSRLKAAVFALERITSRVDKTGFCRSDDFANALNEIEHSKAAISKSEGGAL